MSSRSDQDMIKRTHEGYVDGARDGSVGKLGLPGLTNLGTNTGALIASAGSAGLGTGDSEDLRRLNEANL